MLNAPAFRQILRPVLVAAIRGAKSAVSDRTLDSHLRNLGRKLAEAIEHGTGRASALRRRDEAAKAAIAGAGAARCARRHACPVARRDDCAGDRLARLGVTSAAMAELVERLPEPSLAFGANCEVEGLDLMRAVMGLILPGTPRPVMAKGQCRYPTIP